MNPEPINNSRTNKVLNDKGFIVSDRIPLEKPDRDKRQTTKNANCNSLSLVDFLMIKLRDRSSGNIYVKKRHFCQ